MGPRALALIGALGVLLVLVTPATATAATVQVPVTIDRTGTVDVTAELQTFIAGAPDGSTIEFPARARYRVDGSIRVEGRNRLVIDGNGSEFVAKTPADRNRRHWWFIGGSDLTVREVIVRGANPAAGTGEAAYRADREAQHGFDISGVAGVLLERVEAYDVWGDFVYIGTGAGRWSSQVVVRDSTFARNGRQGISITGGEDVLIERNRIAEIRRSAFDLEPNGPAWGVRRVRIVGNQIGATRLNFVAGHGAAAPFDDVVVERNVLIGAAMSIDLEAPATSRRGAIRIVGNTSNVNFGSSAPPIKISGYDAVVVRDNRMPVDARRRLAGIRIRSSCGVDIGGNSFPGAVAEADVDGHPCGGAGSAGAPGAADPGTGSTAAPPSTATSTPRSTPTSTASVTPTTSPPAPSTVPTTAAPATTLTIPAPPAVTTGPEAVALPPFQGVPGEPEVEGRRGGPVIAALAALAVIAAGLLRVVVKAGGEPRSSPGS